MPLFPMPYILRKWAGPDRINQMVTYKARVPYTGFSMNLMLKTEYLHLHNNNKYERRKKP